MVSALSVFSFYAYYALVPFSFLADVITYPIQFAYKIISALGALRALGFREEIREFEIQFKEIKAG
ncbi:hypothetical protein CH363_05275 [Leptospira haakeii]|uniref:Uncharacterized protein n=1 Tax=Leptospira haakeii TaxID=2023198 RepID=A0ABX4PPM1_9LEPT|nr:hypothetical protein CH363_05275 [Leptospira haakeii]PKA19298.1 hypothetical protein CH377_13325 [Leptospira haakeii]